MQTSHNLFRIYKSILSILIFVILLFTVNKPLFAVDCPQMGDDPPAITEIVCPIVRIINIGMIISAAVLIIMLLFGAIKLALAFGDPKGFQAAKGTMTWALIGFLVVIFALTILTLLVNTLGLNLSLNPFDEISNRLQALFDLTVKP